MTLNDPLFDMEYAAMERWRNGDPMGWAEISAEDVVYIEPSITKPVVGLEEYKAHLKKAEGLIRYQRSEFLNPVIARAGSAAVLSYNYRSAVLAEDGSVVSQLPWNATEVYALRAGKWKIVHTHWSFVRQKLPESVEVPLTIHYPPIEQMGAAAEVFALEKGAMERWRKGDPWGFAELYAPEITYFDTGTEKRLDGLDALKAELQTREGKIFYDVMDFIEPRYLLLGDMAVLTYRFLETNLNGDGSVALRRPWNCSEVFAKRKGSWKIIHSHWSFIKGELA